MSTMTRVSRSHPCPVCKKSDWCLMGTDVVVCMRVQSSRVKMFADSTIGWLHRRNGDPLPLPPPRKAVQPDFNSGKLLQKWAVDYGFKSLNYLARTLSVSVEALEKLRCVKAPQHCVWGFPMYDGAGNIIGIRMRHENGRKWCEPGGHNGLFLPSGTVDRHIVICEGPTDTAAALTIGLYAIGRFNCCGGIHQIQDFVRRNHVKRAMIVADVDQDREINGQVVNPGITGAITLAEHLGIPSCTVTLPAKDMRDFVQRGGDRKTFLAITNQLVWSQS